MTFGDKIRTLRKGIKISQKKLAKESGIPFYTIVALENNRSKVPLITTVLKVSKYFDVSIDRLVKDVNFS